MHNLNLSVNENWHPKYLHYISAALVTCYLATIIIASKQTEIYGLVFGVGTLTFPFVMILGDIMSEVYGFKRSRQVIWIGFWSLIAYMFITQIALYLPSAPSWTFQSSFQDVLGAIPRITISGLIAYLVSDLTNSYVLTKMKVKQGSNGFGLRAVASTVVGQGVDGLIFWPLAFYGVIPTDVLITIIFSTWIIRVIIEIVFLPVTSQIVKKVKILEGIEHFDAKPEGDVRLKV
jgi:uncharacterized integral membrane protein (TIGR00697 family)